MFQSNKETWYKIDEHYYRKVFLFDLEWCEKRCLSHCLVKASTFSGPLAVFHTKNHMKPHPTLHTKDLYQTMTLHSAKGSLISTLSWTYDAFLVAEWSVDFLLIVVFVTGVVRVFSPFGEVKYCYVLQKKVTGEEEDDDTIVSAALSKDLNLITVITKSMKILVNQHFEYSKCLHIHTLPTQADPLSTKIDMEIIHTPFQTNPRNGDRLASLCIIVSIQGEGYFLVTQRTILKVKTLLPQHVRRMASSPCGTLLAVLCKENSLSIFSCRDLPNVSLLYSVSPPNATRIVDFCWINQDSLVSYVRSTSDHSVGEHHQLYIREWSSEWVRLSLSNDPVVMVQDYDGVRLLSPTVCHKVETLEVTTQNIFLHPPQSHYERFFSAYTKYHSGELGEDDQFFTSFVALPDILFSCLDAAGREYDLGVIYRILNAFIFGKLFLKEYIKQQLESPLLTENASSLDGEMSSSLLTQASQYLSRAYIALCKDLRVVQALSASPYAMCLTVAQLRTLGQTTLLKCLAHRHFHFLALKIAESWGLGSVQSDPLIWTAAEIDSSQDLRDICSSCRMYTLTHMSSGVQSYDATRPIGVSLAIDQELRDKQNQPISVRSLHASSYTTRCFLITPPITDETLLGHEEHCFSLREAVDYVFDHWIREKIMSSVELFDQQLFEEIKKTFATVAHFRPKFVRFVLEAVKLSRPHLAVLLLQYEPRCRVQVRILLRLAEYELAMKQAVKACDTDLLVECLASLEAAHPNNDEGGVTSQWNHLPNLIKVFAHYPYLYNFYETLCLRQKKMTWIKRLYEEVGEFGRAAWVCVIQAILESSERRKELFAHAAAFFGASTAEQGFLSPRFSQTLVLEHVELLELQKQWDRLALEDTSWGSNCHLEGLPLFATLTQLFVRERTNEIEAVKKLFSVPQSRLLKSQIQALLSQDKIDQVEELARSPDLVQRVGGVDFFISALRFYGKSDCIDRLMPTLRSSMTQSKKTWLPKVFRTSETSDMKRVALVLASLREESKDGPNSSVLPHELHHRIEKFAQTFWGSFAGALSRRSK